MQKKKELSIDTIHKHIKKEKELLKAYESMYCAGQETTTETTEAYELDFINDKLYYQDPKHYYSDDNEEKTKTISGGKIK